MWVPVLSRLTTKELKWLCNVGLHCPLEKVFTAQENLLRLLKWKGF